MRRIAWTVAWAVVLPLTFAAEARAQANPYEIEPYVGAFVNDFSGGDDETDVILGVRLLQSFPSGWGWGGSFGFVPLDEIALGPGFEDEDINVNLFVYNGEVSYTFPTTGRTHVFVLGGVGAATLQVDDIPGEDDDRSETDVLVPLGGGVKFMNDAANPTWGVRAEVRDHIVFVDGDDRDGDTDQSVEISFGFSFVF